MLDIIYSKVLKYFNETTKLGLSTESQEKLVNNYIAKIYKNFIPTRDFYVISYANKDNLKQYSQAYYDKYTYTFLAQDLQKFNNEEFKKVFVRTGFLTFKDVLMNQLTIAYYKEGVKSLIKLLRKCGYDNEQVNYFLSQFKNNDSNTNTNTNTNSKKNETEDKKPASLMDAVYKDIRNFFLQNYLSTSPFRVVNVNHHSESVCYDIFTNGYSDRHLYVIKDNITKEYMQCFYDKKIKKYITQNSRTLDKKEFKKLYVRKGCLNFDELRYNVGLEIYKKQGEDTCFKWLRKWLNEPQVYIIIENYKSNLIDTPLSENINEEYTK